MADSLRHMASGSSLAHPRTTSGRGCLAVRALYHCLLSIFAALISSWAISLTRIQRHGSLRSGCQGRQPYSEDCSTSTFVSAHKAGLAGEDVAFRTPVGVLAAAMHMHQRNAQRKGRPWDLLMGRSGGLLFTTGLGRSLPKAMIGLAMGADCLADPRAACLVCVCSSTCCALCRVAVAGHLSGSGQLCRRPVLGHHCQHNPSTT